jgi:hypothetical protein
VTNILRTLWNVSLTRGGLVGIATRLRAGRSGFRISVKETDFSLLRNVHTGSGARSPSYSMGTGVLFPGVRRLERHVDMPLHTVQHAKRMNLCCRITTLEDSNFNEWFSPGSKSSLMMISWWSKHVGVILSVLMCDIRINVLLQTSALDGTLYIVNWNARRNSEKETVKLQASEFRANAVQCPNVRTSYCLFVCFLRNGVIYPSAELSHWTVLMTITLELKKKNLPSDRIT